MHILLGMVILVICLFLLKFASKIDGNPKVDETDWRVKPSQSGKTSEAYRWAGGLGAQQRRTRFKSKAAAEAWVRTYGKIYSKAPRAGLSDRCDASRNAVRTEMSVGLVTSRTTTL